MTMIYDEMQTVKGEVTESSYEEMPESNDPPFEPPNDKTYGGDHRDDDDGGVPEGAVSLSPRHIYAGLLELFDALDVKGFEDVNKAAAVHVFVQGYNKFDESKYDDSFWDDLDGA